jgi:DNA-directed RNA polymerase subunit L
MSIFSEFNNNNELDITFNIKSIDLSVINSLRRVIISEIPNVGFLFNHADVSKDQHIKVITNNSPLHNELIQQRFSLIPIHVNTQELENWDENDYEFVLNKTNDNIDILNIYSSDITVIKNNVEDKALSKRFFPPDPITKGHILLTKLKPIKDSSIHIQAKASINIGANFTSFGIVSTCCFEHIVDEVLAKKTLKKYLDANENKDTLENLTYQFNSIEKERCYHRNIYREPNFFKFHIISESGIPATYIFEKALYILKTKFIELQTNLDFEVIEDNKFFTIVIKNENHTLGNVLQSLCFNKFIRELQDSKEKDAFNLKYIGYNVPHPLEAILLIKIKGDNIQEIKDVKIFVSQACEYIIEYISTIEEQWKVFGN